MFRTWITINIFNNKIIRIRNLHNYIIIIKITRKIMWINGSRVRPDRIATFHLSTGILCLQLIDGWCNLIYLTLYVLYPWELLLLMLTHLLHNLLEFPCWFIHLEIVLLKRLWHKWCWNFLEPIWTLESWIWLNEWSLCTFIPETWIVHPISIKTIWKWLIHILLIHVWVKLILGLKIPILHSTSKILKIWIHAKEISCSSLQH